MGIRKDKLKDELEELRLQRDLNEAQLRNAEILADPVKSAVIELTKEMNNLNNAQMQAVKLSEAMSTSFEDSFKGIIRGTMTVQDAFRNMLNKIADFFIETAAQMAANQFQQSLLGILGKGLGSAFSFGSSFKNFGGTSVGTAGQFVGKSSAIGFAADGGRIPGGRPTLVGERGPELFTPGVSGMITPNHALGGSTSIVVNVDASGSSVEGDEQGGRELGRLISVAIQSELVQQKRPGGLLA